MDKLNHLFKTNVELVNTTIDHANVEPNTIDVAISISVIEHLPWADVESVMRCVWDLLKPGGVFILTVDLFLDVKPFANATNNKYGSNINIKNLIEVMPFNLALGNTHELFGYSDFDPACIESNQEQYFIGKGYPAMIQCIVLRKPS